MTFQQLLGADTFALVLEAERARDQCRPLTATFMRHHVAMQRFMLGGVFFVLPHHRPLLRDRDITLFTIEVEDFMAHESPDGLTPVSNHFTFTGNRERPKYSVSLFETDAKLNENETSLVRALVQADPLMRVACGAWRLEPDDFVEFPCDRNDWPVHVRVLMGISFARLSESAAALKKYHERSRAAKNKQVCGYPQSSNLRSAQ